MTESQQIGVLIVGLGLCASFAVFGHVYNRLSTTDHKHVAFAYATILAIIAGTLVNVTLLVIWLKLLT